MVLCNRNGRNGRLLVEKYSPDTIPRQHQSARMVRSILQGALLTEVDQTRVHVGKNLIGIEQLPDDRLRISFRDGFVDEVDLLIGADGIRSVRTQPTVTPRWRLNHVNSGAASDVCHRLYESLPFPTTHLVTMASPCTAPSSAKPKPARSTASPGRQSSGSTSPANGCLQVPLETTISK